MTNRGKVKVGIIGSQFEADIHAASFQIMPEEADEMIDTCRREGVLLFYAEELFFTPKYVKAKQMAGEGGVTHASLLFRPAGVRRPVDLWWRGLQRSG